MHYRTSCKNIRVPKKVISNPDLRGLYVPIQPAVKGSQGAVTYREFLPHALLQPYLYCYWQLKTKQTLTAPFYYRVVADGCIDIFFSLERPDESFVMGFSRRYVEFLLENRFNYVGVRFLPTMFPQFFGIDASYLSNRYERLQAIIPETGGFITQRFNTECSVKQIKTLFDSYFLKLLESISLDFDPRLYNAMEIILNRLGMVNVESDLDTGISSRQLRRLFQFYIGDTAKTFSKVVRFQNILRAKPSSQSLRENKLFFDAGYYDQSHFIKEFKNFYGVTPSKAFGR